MEWMPAFQNVGLELSFNQKKNNITPSQKEMEIERINHNLNINCCILGLISDDNDCIFVVFFWKVQNSCETFLNCWSSLSNWSQLWGESLYLLSLYYCQVLSLQHTMTSGRWGFESSMYHGKYEGLPKLMKTDEQCWLSGMWNKIQ